MQPLIIGLDPGTTTGYAILGLDGKLIEAYSARELELDGVISRVFKKGTPVLVGCDKKKTPSFVKNFSRKTGAKVISPPLDMTKKEKKLLVNEKVKNDHESDSIAGARFAYFQYAELFDKIDRQLVQMSKKDLSDKVKLFLIRHEEMNIQSAVEYLDKRPEPKVIKKESPRIPDNPSRMIGRIGAKLIMLEKENIFLHEEIDDMEKLVIKLKRKKSRDELLREKENRILGLQREILNLKKDKKEINKEKEFLARNSQNIIVKKLENLGLEEFQKKKYLHIGKNDIIYVENLSIHSEKVLNQLKGKVEIIITKKRPSGISGFKILNDDNMHLTHNKDFCAVSSEEIEELLKKEDILGDLISEYKKERTKQKSRTIHDGR